MRGVATVGYGGGTLDWLTAVSGISKARCQATRAWLAAAAAWACWARYRDIPRENRTVSFILTVDLSMRAECMHEK